MQRQVVTALGLGALSESYLAATWSVPCPRTEERGQGQSRGHESSERYRFDLRGHPVTLLSTA